ncbi:MAG: spore coat U domain-containing protein [Myxococcota bacterium]|nr:spore coat U domain-containing protein [Myxococcota bacterium]
MSRIVKHILVAASTFVAVAVPLQALAGTATQNLSVTATIAANCTISTTAVAFGSYDPIVTNASTPLDSTGTVTTTCSTGASPQITLGQGANAGGGSTDTVPVRQMASGAARLGYSLYQQTGRTTVWGNTLATAPAAVTGTGVAQVFTVYGRVPAAQNVATGSYTDTVVATVNF